MNRTRQPILFLVVVSSVVLAAVWYAHSGLRPESPPGYPNKVPATFESHDVLPDKYHFNNSHIVSQSTTQTIPLTRKNFGRARPSGYDLRIVAIGDLHGDFKSTVHMLRMAGVVDVHGHWTGYVHYLVQTGDVLDRGDDTMQLYSYMEILRAQAREVGGRVVSLLGNHEYMNLIPNWDFVSSAELASFGSILARWFTLTEGFIGTSWRNHYMVASRLPLHPSRGGLNTDYVEDPNGNAGPLSHAAISFVHGGLSPTYRELTPFPSRINALGASVLEKLQELSNRVPLTDEEARLLDGNSPLCYRGWAETSEEVPEEEVCAMVDEVLRITGTRRMIMGHTAQLDYDGILSRCEDKIFIIDTGLSSVYEDEGGQLSALRIEYTLTPAPVFEPVEDARQQVWIEREVITGVYDDREEEMVDDVREIVGDFAL